MSDKYKVILEHLKAMETDVEKFYVKGQSAAGTRVRKGLNELKKLSQDMRNEIQQIKESKAK